MAANISGRVRTRRKPPEKTTDPPEATGKLCHIHTLAEFEPRTHADRREMAVIHNGQRFRPLGAPI